MDDILKAAFVFVAPEADPAKHRQWIETPMVHLLTVGVKDYAQAVVTCKELVEKEGIKAIELCGGFGNRGTALIAEAVGNGVAVGAVRFDVHPGLGNVSGDTIFA
ncbi:DUF6506 family protein [Desulfogranum japonicum]|uniref:DUF6506 family protein n=1 Tax=Desulfogranum japonicum TaxID=231447 RepID=UPI0004020CEB|nr:DUF6506 family protein [Desulfogranum japonicum]